MNWRMKRWGVAWCVVTFLLGLATRVGAAETEPEVQVEVAPLVDGVWVHTSWKTVRPWGRVPSNGLIVREGDHVVVVDTAWGAKPSLALLAWIDRELKLPVARLIVTHFHDDRLAGWEVFAERGARVVASQRTLELAGVEATAAFDVYRLAPGEKRASGACEIFYPGPAHAADNVVVWLPAVKVLAGGCAVREAATSGMGNVADASVREWADSMRRLLQAYPDAERVLPGHGAIGDLALVRHTIDLAEAAAALP